MDIRAFLSGGKRQREDAPALAEDAPAPGRAAPTETASLPPTPPCKILTWNANGFASRAEAGHLAEFGRLLSEHSVDVVCVQEARVKAHCANPKDSAARRDRGKPAADEEKARVSLTKAPFDGARLELGLAQATLPYPLDSLMPIQHKPPAR